MVFRPSNSNISSNHYLTIGGVTTPTYTSECAVDIFMTDNFHNALKFSNGMYLAYDKVNHKLTMSSKIVEDESSNITTDIDLLAVPYPYIHSTLVGEADGFEDSSEGAFGIVYLPFPMQLLEGVEAFIGTTEPANLLNLTKVENNGAPLPPGAYVLHSTTSGEQTVSPANSAPCTVSDNIFFGSTKNPLVTSGDTELYAVEELGSKNPYVLSKHVTKYTIESDEIHISNEGRDVQIGFYEYIGKGYPKGKAIYSKSSSAGTVHFGVCEEDDVVEGIESTPETTPASNGTAYDLTGRRVTSTYKGIKIVGGKKMF